MKLIYSSILLGLLASAIHGEIVTLAHPEEKLPANSTAIWSPLFQATWDKLNSNLGGPPTKIDPPNALMTKLDAFKWNAGQVMPEGSWKTWCGPATQDFLKKVNEEAATLSQTKNGPFKLASENPAGLASFGLLDREVTFIKSFARCIKEPINFRVGSAKQPVQFFGTKVEDDVGFAESVLVLAFRPVDQSFAIQISSKQSDDKVILYRPAKEQDFASACHWLRTWRSQFNADKERSGAWDDCFLHAGDEIQIPYVDLNTTADLSNRLGGRRDHQGHPWVITRAEQITKFQLHEKGARVRVEVSLEASPLAATPQTTPRKFIFDRPFFVFLWRDKAEWPFFGAWIGDASALKAFQ
jgi:hypothetical protein